MLTQGFHVSRRRVLRYALALGGLAPAMGFSGASWAGSPRWPRLQLQRLSPEVWWLRGADGEANAVNRGQVSTLCVVRQGREVWVLGSGPSPAFARALGTAMRTQWGLRVTDVVSPWARPELVLGQRGFGPVRRWAHADVALAMSVQCARCEERLRGRLGGAAGDLGRPPAAWVPERHFEGASGSLGPWQWWRLARAEASIVTAFRLRWRPWWSAPGLLWSDGPPDLRDADVIVMRDSTARLLALAQPDGMKARWLPEQGPVMDRSDVEASLAYLAGLSAAVRARLDAGGLATDPPVAWPGLMRAWMQHPRHAMNWQRVWRLAEDAALAPGR